MAKRTFLAGATSQTIDIFIQDSSKTDGSGLASLVYNSSGLTAYYRKGATGTPTAISLVTQTVGGAFSAGGFVELDATHTKGLYRLDVPDTVFASTPYATIFLYGATNMAPVAVELEIVAYNPFSATPGITVTAGTVSDKTGYTVSTVSDKTGYSLTQSFPSNFASLAIDTSGRVNAFLIGILTSVFTEGATGRIAAAFKQFFNVASPASTMEAITGVGTVTTTTTATNLTNAPTAGDFTAAMKTSLNAATPASVVGAVGSVTGAVGSVTGAVGSVTAGVTLASGEHTNIAADVQTGLTAQGFTSTRAGKIDNLDRAISAVLTTAMTESYNTDGVAPTPAQALFLVMQRLTEFAISGTSISIKKLDGSTQAAVLTIDDATAPTSSTRTA